MTQLSLPASDVYKVVDGVEMGVLKDGTAYLTGRGLARVCGITSGMVSERTKDWEQGKRDGKLAKGLVARGVTELYIPVVINGTKVYAYPDRVCTAFLEYYAYLANPTSAKGFV